MTRDSASVYVFDPELDDSRRWEAGVYTCPECGYEFAYVCRVDQEPACVRCVESYRWRRESAYLN